MTLQNNNKQIIRQLSLKSFISNPFRNYLTLSAIALTTVLFTVLFSMGFSTLESYEQLVMRQVGTSAHIGFQYLDESMVQSIETHPSIEKFGHSVIIGMCENLEFSKFHTEIRYANLNQSKMWFSTPTTGKLPNKANEVALSTDLLDAMGLPHQLGTQVILEYSLGNVTKQETFMLSGFWDHEQSLPMHMIYVSDEYATSLFQDPLILFDNYSGTHTVDIEFNNKNNLETKAIKLLSESFVDADEALLKHLNPRFNPAYDSPFTGLDLSSLLIIAILLFIVFITGFLIIYNIFYIFVMKETRFYGLLKTIGMTQRQIKKYMFFQSIILSAIGIPIGLFLGFLLSMVLVPELLSLTTLQQAYISFHPLIFLGASLFSLFTVLISGRKPGKLASKVSPIEATKLISKDQSVKFHKKQTKKTASPFQMGYSNLLRNRKKVVYVILSNVLCLILFNSIVTYTNSYDEEKFLNGSVVCDFIVGHDHYFNVISHFSKEDEVVSESLIQMIESQIDSKSKGRIYYDLDYKKTDVNGISSMVQLYGYDAFPLTLLENVESNDTLENLKGLDQIIYIRSRSTDETPYHLGDTVTIVSGDGAKKDFQIAAIADMRSQTSIRFWYMPGQSFVLPTNAFKSYVSEPLTMSYVFNAPQKIEEMERFLDQHTSKPQVQMNYESREKYREQITKAVQSMLLIGSLLSAIVGIIAILNFINSFMTSIHERRMEFAMMRSIGMTQKQLFFTLLVESGMYFILSLISALSLSLLVSMTLLKPLISSVWFSSFKPTLVPILLASPLLCFFSIIIPVIAYFDIKKYSIIEMLREAS